MLKGVNGPLKIIAKYCVFIGFKQITIEMNFEIENFACMKALICLVKRKC